MIETRTIQTRGKSSNLGQYESEEKGNEGHIGKSEEVFKRSDQKKENVTQNKKIT